MVPNVLDQVPGNWNILYTDSTSIQGNNPIQAILQLSLIRSRVSGRQRRMIDINPNLIVFSETHYHIFTPPFRLVGIDTDLFIFYFFVLRVLYHSYSDIVISLILITCRR